MAFYQTIKCSNGTYNTYKFTMADLAGLEVARISLWGIMLILFLSAMPMYFYLSYVFSFHPRSRPVKSILGLISSTYLLLDYHFGWIIWTTLGYNFQRFAHVLSCIWCVTGIYFLFTTFLGKILYRYYLKKYPENKADAEMFMSLLSVTLFAIYLVWHGLQVAPFPGVSAFDMFKD